MGIKLNLADVEVRDFDPLPVGDYPARITDYEPRAAGENAKNPGKFYLNTEFTVTEGKYEDRKAWTNINFGANALFTLKGIAQATGTEDAIEACEGEDEDYEDLAQAVGQVLEGQELIIKVRKAKTRKDEAGNVINEGATEVKGFKALSEGKATAGSASSSLLP